MDAVLEKINRAGIKFLTPLSLQQTYNTIAEEGVRLLGALYGVLYIVQNGTLLRVAIYPPDWTNWTKPRRHGFTYRAYREGEAMVIRAKDHPQFRGKKYGSAVFIPISYHNRSVGALSLVTPKEKKFTGKELKALKIFGSYASLAIKKSQLYEETRKALEIRDLFISMAAHELRTPLTTINGYVQLLHAKTAGENSAPGRWVNELLAETQRLTKLVNELLQVNRIKSGKLDYVWRECSLKAVLRRAVQSFEFSHPQRKVVFQDGLQAKEDLVIGDFDKLLQAILNVLDNAAKFSPAEKEIILTVKYKPPFFVIRVKDFGQGIAEKEISKIFDWFYKGKHNTGQGMGIGLSLAKDIIQQHHGLINVSSRPNKGTTIEVKLPEAKVKV